MLFKKVDLGECINSRGTSATRTPYFLCSNDVDFQSQELPRDGFCYLFCGAHEKTQSCPQIHTCTPTCTHAHTHSGANAAAFYSLSGYTRGQCGFMQTHIQQSLSTVPLCIHALCLATDHWPGFSERYM